MNWRLILAILNQCCRLRVYEVEDIENVRRLTGRLEAIQDYAIKISVSLMILGWFVSSITGFKLIYLIPLVLLIGSFFMKPRLIAVRYYRKEMLEGLQLMETVVLKEMNKEKK